MSSAFFFFFGRYLRPAKELNGKSNSFFISSVTSFFSHLQYPAYFGGNTSSSFIKFVRKKLQNIFS